MKIPARLHSFLRARPVTAEGSGFRWPGGVRAAVTLTYDDGLDVHLDHVVPDLETAKLRGTFYLPGNAESLRLRLQDWRAVTVQGHELGNHSAFHPCLRHAGDEVRAFVTPERELGNYTVDRMVDEIRLMNTLLNAVDGRVARTLAYPCGDTFAGGMSYVDPVRPLVRAARTLGGALSDPRRLDPHLVAGWGVDGARRSGLIARVNDAIRTGALAVFVFHGVGGGHEIDVARDDHRALLSWLDGNRHCVWTAPFLEVIDHVTAERARLDTP
ncbi:MAG TPA: polysaccharide deacetylase family protein [Candidatus Methylomirabilis sp.]|nr:polysaccharide deacetylase family protein [Candidatus Methylomirabilis sp.]